MTGLPSLSDALKKHRGAEPALFLDVDGTILEFSETPGEVVVPPTLVDTLARLHSKLDGALALVSGRALDDLDRLFQPLHLPAAGLHGFHVRGARDELSAHDEYALALAPERAKLHALFERDQRILIEDKGPCIAVHFRRAPDMNAVVGDAVRESLSHLGERFEVLSGHMLFELRPAGVGKGHAIDILMKSQPFAGRLPVFIGDDVTDEDGFEAVNTLGGISACVGTRRPTKATAKLENVGAVRAWLNELAETPGTSSGAASGKETMQA